MKTWVSADSRVLPDAIDSKGSSCVRAKYGVPSEAKVEARGRTGVATTRPDCLPTQETLSNGVQYEGFAVDEPADADNHAEVRARRAADRPSRDCRFPGGAAAKLELKTILARSFKVTDPPT